MNPLLPATPVIPSEQQQRPDELDQLDRGKCPKGWHKVRDFSPSTLAECKPRKKRKAKRKTRRRRTE